MCYDTLIPLSHHIENPIVIFVPWIEFMVFSFYVLYFVWFIVLSAYLDINNFQVKQYNESVSHSCSPGFF